MSCSYLVWLHQQKVFSFVLGWLVCFVVVFVRGKSRKGEEVCSQDFVCIYASTSGVACSDCLGSCEDFFCVRLWFQIRVWIYFDRHRRNKNMPDRCTNNRLLPRSCVNWIHFVDVCKCFFLFTMYFLRYISPDICLLFLSQSAPPPNPIFFPLVTDHMWFCGRRKNKQ